MVRQAFYYLITVSPLPYILSQQAHLIHRFLLFKQLVYADFLFSFLSFFLAFLYSSSLESSDGAPFAAAKRFSTYFCFMNSLN